MILITGGAYQGKLAFAKTLYPKSQEPEIADGETKEISQLCQADIIFHFHLWIRRILKEERDPFPLVEELLRQNPKVIIVVNQLGCGVVPVEAFDRKYREYVGNMGILLAKQASLVYQVNCGIGKRLK